MANTNNIPLDEQHGQDVNVNIKIRRDVCLWLLLALLTVSVIYRVMNDRYKVNEPFVIQDENSQSLLDKINPNTASWASLARLPGIGPGKAKAIIKFREEYKQSNGRSAIAFQTDNDLCKVKGIGGLTVEKIKEYLVYGTMGDTEN